MNETRLAIACTAVLVAAAAWMLRLVEDEKAQGGVPLVAKVPAGAHTGTVEVVFPEHLPVPPRRKGEARHPLADDEVEVCGIGRVKGKDRQDAIVAAANRVMQAGDRLAQRLTASLVGSDDHHERALGRMVRLGESRARAVEASTATAHGGCDEDATCTARAFEAASAAGAEDRAALVADAVSSDDPRVYAAAWAACADERGDARCQQLKPEQWARIDPDNAVPWLWLASEASQRRDPAGVDEALFRASKARRADAHWGAALELMQREEVASQPPAARLGLLYRLIGITATQPGPSFYQAVQRCRPPGDVNWQQSCSDLADVLVERSLSMVDLTVGLRIAEAAGWAESRVQRLATERDAMAQAQSESADLLSSDGGMGCDALDAMTAWAGQVATVGEIGALRTKLLKVPGGVEAAAERFRERRRQRMEEVGRQTADAAPPADAPSASASADVQLPTAAHGIGGIAPASPPL